MSDLDSDDSDSQSPPPQEQDPIDSANVVVCRDLFHPERSVIVPRSAIGLRPPAPRPRTTVAAAIPPGRTELQQGRHSTRKPSERAAPPRRREPSSGDEEQDEKRPKLKTPTPPSRPAPKPTTRIVDSSHDAPQPQRQSPRRRLSSSERAYTPPPQPMEAFPFPEGFRASSSSSSRSAPADEAADSSASDYSDGVEHDDDDSRPRYDAPMTSTSTDYRAIESVPIDAAPLPSPPTPPPQAAASYAAATASPRPPTIRFSSPPQSPRQPTPPTAQRPTEESKRYPPIMVDEMPDWPKHMQALKAIIGRLPGARPFGRGLKFMPSTPEEYRAVQAYLVKLSAEDPGLSWHAYALKNERPQKIALWGLPAETPADLITEALKEKGFPARYARALPMRKNTNKCVYHIQLDPMSKEELENMYKIQDLLNMPGVRIEGWRGNSSMPQCHRCQGFGHSSTHCHRPYRCVKCAGPHPGSTCPRAQDAPLLCANCNGPHAANSRTCAIFRREARKRQIRLPGRPPVNDPDEAPPAPTPRPTEPPPQQLREQRLFPAPTTLNPPANDYVPRSATAPTVAPRKRRRNRKRSRRGANEAPAAASTPVALPAYPAYAPYHFFPPLPAPTISRPRPRRGGPRRRQKPAPAEEIPQPAATETEAPTAPPPAAQLTAARPDTEMPAAILQHKPEARVTHTPATAATTTATTTTAPTMTRPKPRYTSTATGAATQPGWSAPAPRSQPPPQYFPPGWRQTARHAFMTPPMPTRAHMDPIAAVVGAIMGLLSAIAAGEDLRVAAMHGLASLAQYM